MKNFEGNSIILDLCSTYHELKSYTFKVVLNPKLFQHSKDVNVEMIDPNGKNIDLNIQRWGKKLICTFNLNKEIPDGVCVIKVFGNDCANKQLNNRFHCWVIK